MNQFIEFNRTNKFFVFKYYFFDDEFVDRIVIDIFKFFANIFEKITLNDATNIFLNEINNVFDFIDEKNRLKTKMTTFIKENLVAMFLFIVKLKIFKKKHKKIEIKYRKKRDKKTVEIENFENNLMRKRLFFFDVCFLFEINCYVERIFFVKFID